MLKPIALIILPLLEYQIMMRKVVMKKRLRGSKSHTSQITDNTSPQLPFIYTYIKMERMTKSLYLTTLIPISVTLHNRASFISKFSHFSGPQKKKKQ